MVNEPLFEIPDDKPKRTTGRLEKRVYQTARELARDGITTADAVLVGAELALAAAIDHAEREKAKGWEYAVAANARELLKVHEALTKAGGEAGPDDALAAAIADLSKPSVDA